MTAKRQAKRLSYARQHPILGLPSNQAYSLAGYNKAQVIWNGMRNGLSTDHVVCKIGKPPVQSHLVSGLES